MTSLRAILEKFTHKIDYTAHNLGSFLYVRFWLLAIMGIGLFLLIVFAALVWLLEVVLGLSLSLSIVLISVFLVPLAMVLSIIYRYKKSMPVDLRSRIMGLIIYFVGLIFLPIFLTLSNFRGKGDVFIIMGLIVAIPIGALMAIIGLYSNEEYIGKNMLKDLFKKLGMIEQSDAEKERQRKYLEQLRAERRK